MDFVSSTENIMLKIGPTRITAAVILDKRPDIDTLLNQLSAIVERVPRLRSNFAWFWLWYIRKPAPFDIGHHVASLDDGSIADVSDVEELLERARCFALPVDRPPWLMVAVNATGRGKGAASGLPAVLFHFDHSIADGIRALEVVTRLPSDPEISAALADAAAHKTEDRGSLPDFGELASDDRIPPLPLVCVSVKMADLKRARQAGHDLSDEIIGAIDAILDDGELFDQSAVRQKKVALVRLTQRRVESGALGNHVSVVDRESVSEQAQATTRRGMLPSLKAERTTQSRQLWMSPFPGSLTRKLAGQWYAQFDALLTIIPGGRNQKSFADAPIDQIYGVAPFLADIRLNVAVIVYGDRINLTFLAKSHFLGDKVLMRNRLHEALVSGAQSQQPAKAVAMAELG